MMKKLIKHFSKTPSGSMSSLLEMSWLTQSIVILVYVMSHVAKVVDATKIIDH